MRGMKYDAFVKRGYASLFVVTCLDELNFWSKYLRCKGDYKPYKSVYELYNQSPSVIQIITATEN